MSEKAKKPAQPLFEDVSAEAEVVDEKLKAYKEALEQEWDKRVDPTKASATAKEVKEQIRKDMPDYITNMRGLAMGAISESVKYQANKFMIDLVMGVNGPAAKDPLAELLGEMEELDNKAKK